MTPAELTKATWVAKESIARFTARLEEADGPIERQMLEATLVIERDRLASLSAHAQIKAKGKLSLSNGKATKKDW